MGKWQNHDWWQNKRSDSTQHKAELDAVKRFEEECMQEVHSSILILNISKTLITSNGPFRSVQTLRAFSILLLSQIVVDFRLMVMAKYSGVSPPVPPATTSKVQQIR